MAEKQVYSSKCLVAWKKKGQTHRVPLISLTLQASFGSAQARSRTWGEAFNARTAPRKSR